MLDYAGCPCRICGKEFTEQDDIVVCPDCGTPYHRSCYAEAGHCTNTELHESGGSWQISRRQELDQKRSEEKRAEQAEQAAERDRGEQPQMFNASLYDGIRLKPDDPTLGLDPNEEYDGTKMGELAEFVRTNRFYYLPLFRLMKQTGKKISFNFVCLLFPEFYFANRKMWGAALLSVLAQIVLSIPMQMIFMTEQLNVSFPWFNPDSVGFRRIYSAANLLHFVFSVGLCLFANYLYYRYTVRRIKKLRQAAVSENDFHRNMQNEGGTSFGNMVLAMVIEGACMFAVMSIMLLL